MKKLLEVKKKIGNLKKNSKNPFFKSAYLDLNDLLNAVEPLLHEQGLILLQPIELGVVSSVLYDAETGAEVCSSRMIIPDNINDPQRLGSCITYFRRYTLKSLLAIAETDDDGNHAAAKPKPLTAEQRLNKATTYNQLVNIWGTLSKSEQKDSAKLKDELKTKLK